MPPTLDQLFLTHHKALFATALAITRDREAAEDSVHDALIAVAETPTCPRDFKAYLFKVVRNKALHQVKRRTAPAEQPDYLEAAEGDGEAAVFARQVARYLEALSTDERTVIILKLFAGYTFAEIGEYTGNSSNTVASWYRRGLRKLKEAIDGRS